MNSKRIAIVGYGYWGNVIHKILYNNNFLVSSIFSSKRRSQLSKIKTLSNSFIDLSEINICNYELIELMNDHDFIFITTGPGYHHQLIKLLNKTNHLSSKPRIWLEKPFLVNPLTYPESYLRNTFVDYPYISENASIQSLEKIKRKVYDFVIINIFSKRNQIKGYGLIFDFLPHCLSILGTLNKDPFLKQNYEFIKVKELISPTSNFNTIYLEGVSSSGLDFIINLGINPLETSSLALIDNSNIYDSFFNFTVPLKELESSNMATVIKISSLYPSPVDTNILRFLSCTNHSEILPNSNLSFHNRIFDISANANSKLNKN